MNGEATPQPPYQLQPPADKAAPHGSGQPGLQHARPASFSSALRQGVRLGRSRLGLVPPAALFLLALAAAVSAGLSARWGGAVEAPGRAIFVVSRWLVPLISFATVSLMTRAQRLDDCLWPYARLGLSRRGLLLGLLASASALAATVTTVAACLALTLAYQGSPGLVADMLTSAWIVALASASYVVFFAYGATWWRGGRGRWLLLGLDFTFGAGTGLLGAIFPASHLRHLVGGFPVLALSQAQSALVLGLMFWSWLLLAGWRLGR